MVVVHHGGDGGEEDYIDVGAVVGTVDADVVIVVADAVLDAGGGGGFLVEESVLNKSFEDNEDDDFRESLL